MRKRKEIELDLVENRENNFYDEVTENQYVMIEVLLDIREILQVQLTRKRD